ncbi:hypothetical protein RRG08_012909, partial [Elysia crispata]
LRNSCPTSNYSFLNESWCTGFQITVKRTKPLCPTCRIFLWGQFCSWQP